MWEFDRGYQFVSVSTYINESIQFSLMDDLVDPAFEVLWIKIRPARLPRGFNCIIVGTVYHPPSASDSEMLNYLINCLSSIEAQSPNSGILLLGDFNKLKVTKLKSSFKLKQIITFPTRGSNTLDPILTNIMIASFSIVLIGNLNPVFSSLRMQQGIFRFV